MAAKHVLVTGANRGIGYAIVKGLVEGGVHTFLGSRDVGLGEEAKKSLGPAAEALVTVVQLDVTDDESVKGAVATVKAALGGTKLTGLINNAGSAFGGMSFTSTDAFNKTMDLNFNGATVRVTEAFMDTIDTESGAGRVVFVSSGAAPTFVGKCSPERQAQLCDVKTTSFEGLKAIATEASALAGGDDPEAVKAAFAIAGLGDGSPYHFSKALMSGYCQVLAKKYPNLRTNSCSPGFIETDLTRAMAAGYGKTPQEMGMKQPEDGAKCPLFLMLGEPIGRGWYYGSDCERSPMDKYRSPGDPPYVE